MTAWGSALPTLYEIETVHWWTRGMLAATQAILEADGWRGDGALLDVGCGGGMAGVQVVARHRIAMDLNWLALMHTRRYPDLRLVQGSMAALPLVPQCCALILALDAIDQRGVDSLAAVAGCAELLEPQGRLLVRVSAHDWIYSTYDTTTGTGTRMAAATLRRIVESAGLTVRRLTYANCCLLPAAVLRRLQARWLGTPVEDDLQPPPAWLSRWLFGILKAEAAWLRRGDLPWGLSLYCLAVKP